ncbi:cold-responsive protein kinase 1-like [Macadamia integrifolia]|uniref:cold-responsive protein kinase 1-like n=1 Tax=Macadamia integrifolia TaxID=60698 RepID=UPI001C4F4781|nr:cold-responsive protein kinase 1-like [Macadamia integrifolia]XP_042500316.1 cold-responsive protein kinase 1-like [Macadamia integrifolia]
MQLQSRIGVILAIQLCIFLVLCDPQTNLLNKGCSQYNATDLPIFYANLNATFTELRNKLAGPNDEFFSTANQGRSSNPVYGMVQCRDYLSTTDCLGCFDAAVALIRTCSAANGARVIFDGCFLRYESSSFFDQTTEPGNTAICGNKTATSTNGLQTTVNTLLTDLVTATPKINGYFAAVKSEAAGSSGTAVYGVAQCALTVSETGCADCLSIAYQNIEICTQDSDSRAVDAGCFMRYSLTAFFADNQTTDIATYLKSGSSSKRNAIIGGVVGGVAFLVLLGLFVAFLLRSKKPKKAREGNILGATELRGPVNFSYRDLKNATKNFSVENKLGEGGFGDVYKGVLRNGAIVAVKKLTIGQSSRAKTDFESEVKLISNVHHRNVVRLLGCCSKGPELLLVYEYMANSSLDKFLFGDKSGTLNWKQRFDIIVGMARGLAYLHEEFHVCIIHRDIKSSNILLDDYFQPRIADFGLARLLPGDQSHLNTRFAGTLGYTSPEYAIFGQLSEKVDTYSFGVVVLEIISGRKSNDIKFEPVTQYLLEWAWKLYEEDKVMNLVDKSLSSDDYDASVVKKTIHIALLCTQSSVAERPAMSEVVVMLLSKGELELRPTRPTFIDATNRIRGDTSSSTGTSSTNANASISEVSGR